MKYEGIIFDLDGVICHTDEYHYQAWKTLADKLGISLNFMGKIEVAFSKPALDTLIEIAEKLETSVSDLTRF